MEKKCKGNVCLLVSQNRWMRWSAYNIPCKCVLQQHSRCNRNMLQGGRREYVGVHLSRSTLRIWCIIGGFNRSWWRRRGSIIFITLSPFTSLWCHNTCGRWHHFQSILFLSTLNSIHLHCIMHFLRMERNLEDNQQTKDNFVRHWIPKLWVVHECTWRWCWAFPPKTRRE